MAGYFTKLNGHIYNGSHKAGETLTNGLFVEITADGVKKITAAKDLEFKILKKCLMFKKKSLVARLVKMGSDEVFFTENEFDINDAIDYNTADYSVAPGTFVKMRRPEVGDEIIQTVSDAVYNGCKVGDIQKPASGGLFIQGPLAPVIGTDLDTEKTAGAGTSITLTIAASTTDSGTLTYAWYHDGSEVEGADADDLTIASPASTDAGVYKCVVTNTLNSLTATTASTECALTVTE